ncbi:transcriptional regulator, SarA/Rot family [Proteiniclasticum sp.]|uniref:MarR family winged helix-turn-helix transcriptional regulator n=1 Tax=Proteiniclasticum sp. TaxID=2053595 RepID=UPI00289E8D0D|nr:MarR family transcriptional regulator [Proteiniclasticum sp.]
MNQSKIILNELLVDLFHDILEIEEKSLRESGSDLTITEMHTIHAVGEERPRTMTEVSRDLNITMGTLTTGVDKLIKKGYLVRKRSEEDKRVVLVELTEKGIEARRMHDSFHQDMISSVIEALDDGEEEVLIQALNKLIGFFDEKYRS